MQQAIKPVLKYPGAKWQIAEWIISHFPAHQHYIEPYFGSGAVFFNKVPAKHEVINDLSGDVVNLFRVIRDEGARLTALVEMTPWSRAEYEMSYQPTDDPVERARRFLVRTWQAHGGALSGTPGWYHQGVSTSYVFAAEKWLSLPAKIASVAKRLAPPVEIECRPALEVIRKHSSSGTLIYADPPYPLSTRAMALYQYEMTDTDHAALLDTLGAHPGPVVLSGYHCELYDDRLKHWAVRERVVKAEKGNTRIEALWLNSVCVDHLGYGPLFDS